jgi:hypothetical protein
MTGFFRTAGGVAPPEFFVLSIISSARVAICIKLISVPELKFMLKFPIAKLSKNTC